LSLEPANQDSVGVAAPAETYTGLLREEWRAIEVELLAIIDESSIRYVNPNSDDSSVFFVGAADWGWAADTPEIVERRRLLRNRYARWIGRFRLLFGDAIPSTTKTIAKADAFFVKWVERPDSFDHSIPRTVSEARNVAAKKLAGFSELLDQIESTRTDGTRMVLDTNALLAQPDIRAFGSIDSQGVVLLVPQVMRELDDLKDRGRTPELRERASKAIRQIKGLRDRGSLLDGVKVANGLTAQALGIEPDFSRLPNSLDPDVPDDRIIGSALTEQAAHPNDVLVLVTSDISAQIKAEMHGVPHVEVPASRSV